MPRAPSTDCASTPTRKNSRKVSMLARRCVRVAQLTPNLLRRNGHAFTFPSAAAGARVGQDGAGRIGERPPSETPLRLPQARLDQVLDRFHEVEARMGAASDGQEIVRLSKEHAELKPVADAVRELARARAV